MGTIILYMSLSGSIAFTLYWIFKWIGRNSISAAFRYRLLKLTMCFFLIPVPYFSSNIRDIIHALIPAFPVDIQPSNVWVYDVSHMIYDTPEGYVFPGYSIWILLLTAANIIAALILLFIRIKNFRKIHQLEALLSDEPEFLKVPAEKIRREFHIRRKVTVYFLDASCSPFCYGFWRPKIVISGEHTPKEYQLLLRHELWHIKACDYITRILAFFLMALHFFNPLAYLLFFEIAHVSELACDEQVISGSSQAERNLYGNLLIEIAAASTKNHSHSFGYNSKKALEERLIMIRKSRKTKYTAFLCCALLTICCSTLSVAAYQPIQITWQDNADYVRNLERSKFVPEGIPDEPEFPPDPYEEYFKTCDSFFVQENGDICFDLDTTEASVQSTCRHSYQAGKTYDHINDGKGGCTYSIYSVERCSKCGNLRNKKFISSFTYAVCPHK